MSRDRRTSGAVHIISLTRTKNVIKLGRGSDSDIRVSDISVSRCHAIISLREGGFYVEDNSSKFGTLVRLKNPIVLDNLNTVAVQIGRTVLSFSVKKVSCLQQSIFKSTKVDKDIINIMPE